MGTAKRCYNIQRGIELAACGLEKIKEKGKEILFVHSENVYLAAVKPVLELFVSWLCVVLACQVKMQKNIVNLVEQGFV